MWNKLEHWTIYLLIYGYSGGLGTREALETLLQKYHEQRKNIYICFIGLEKTLDKDNHIKLLLQILQDIEQDHKETRMIRNLYL